jgi:chemotaxis family two-component system response regulator Rcp1
MSDTEHRRAARRQHGHRAVLGAGFRISLWLGGKRGKFMMTVEDAVRPIEVLLVEDNPGDVRMTKEAFRDINRDIRLHVAYDGGEAMAFLKHEGIHRDAPRPDLILLDLNLTKMDGREVLAYIKQNAGLKMIPTIVLSSSETDADILISYRLHANCYLRKPPQWDAFDSIVRGINAFWLTKTKLPALATGG